MEFLVFYVIFALSTTIMALAGIFIPAIKDVYSTVPAPKIVESGNKYMVLIVLTIMSIIFAPLMFIVCLSPKLTHRFLVTLTTDLKKT